MHTLEKQTIASKLNEIGIKNAEKMTKQRIKRGSFKWLVSNFKEMKKAKKDLSVKFSTIGISPRGYLILDGFELKNWKELFAFLYTIIR